MDRRDRSARDLRGAPTVELVRDAVADVRELVELEVALAREDLRREAMALSVAGIAIGVATVLGIVGFTVLLVGFAMMTNREATTALLIAAGLFVLAVVLVAIGLFCLPKRPLFQTKSRWVRTARELGERVS